MSIRPGACMEGISYAHALICFELLTELNSTELNRTAGVTLSPLPAALSGVGYLGVQYAHR